MSRDGGSKGANSKNGSTPVASAATKFCHILKRPDFEGYGFNLHTEKVKPGQYIGKVDVGSPAEAAGLKEGDRIVEVNGVNIGQETHKQVVQRIKAIANEVRLLLVDADGVGNISPVAAPSTTAPVSSPIVATTNGSSGGNKSVNNHNNNNIKNNNNSSSRSSNGSAEYQGTVQEMPGASANISSISMISTKRSSNASASDSSSPRHSNAVDVTDRAALALPDAIHSHKGAAAAMQHEHNNDNNNMMNNKMSTPPPPSAAIATVPTTAPPKQQPPSANTITAMATPPPPISNSNGGTPAASRPGSLQLQMTAAEMRAKLMAKKKYDPKNENVDLRKKFEIIQKL